MLFPEEIGFATSGREASGITAGQAMAMARGGPTSGAGHEPGWGAWPGLETGGSVRSYFAAGAVPTPALAAAAAALRAATSSRIGP